MTPEKRCRKIYEEVNKDYFNGGLPLDVEFRIIENWGAGRAIDTRHDAACVSDKSEGGFLVEVNRGIVEFKRFLRMTIAHEAVHLRIGLLKDHRSKEWKAEVRRLQGLGLLLEVF